MRLLAPLLSTLRLISNPLHSSSTARLPGFQTWNQTSACLKLQKSPHLRPLDFATRRWRSSPADGATALPVALSEPDEELCAALKSSSNGAGGQSQSQSQSRAHSLKGHGPGGSAEADISALKSWTEDPRSRRVEFRLAEADLVESFVRGSGPGGQAMQKTSNCVRLRHAPTGLAVRVHATRSREDNRRIARKLLRSKLDDFYNGDLSHTAKRQQKEAIKQKRHERKVRKKYGTAGDDAGDDDNAAMPKRKAGLRRVSQTKPLVDDINEAGCQPNSILQPPQLPHTEKDI